MLGIAGILVDRRALPSIDGESGFDPQDIRRRGLRFRKLPQLAVCSSQPKREDSYIRPPRWVYSQRLRSLLVAFDHVVSMAQKTKTGEKMKRIAACIRLERLDRSRWFTCVNETEGKATINEIMVQRERLLEFSDTGLVLTLEQQNPSKLGMSLRKIRI